MSTKSLTVAALAVGAALSFGCQDRPTAPLEDGRQGPRLAKGGNNGGQEPTQTVTFTFRDAETETGAPVDRIYGDKRVRDAGRTAYTDDQCGVVATLPGYGNAYLHTNSYKIKPDEASACGGRERRDFTVDFREARSDDGDPLDWDDQAVDAKWMDLVFIEIRNIELNASEYGKLRIVFESDGGEERGQGFGEACPQSLVFDKDRWPGTSDVLVTRVKERQSPDDYDEWTIEPGSTDVAVCLGGKNEQVPLGYYHLPFQVNVVCRGEACGPS